MTRYTWAAKESRSHNHETLLHQCAMVNATVKQVLVCLLCCGHAIARLGYRRMFAVTQSFAKRLWWILNVKSIFFHTKSGSYKQKVVASEEVSFLLFLPSNSIVYHEFSHRGKGGGGGAGHQKYQMNETCGNCGVRVSVCWGGGAVHVTIFLCCLPLSFSPLTPAIQLEAHAPCPLPPSYYATCAISEREAMQDHTNMIQGREYCV